MMIIINRIGIGIGIGIGIVIFFLPAFLSMNVFGQTEPNKTLVKGQLKTNWSQELKLGDMVCPINKDGTFQFELIVDKPDFYTLSYEDKTLETFIVPGKGLDIVCDGKEFPESLSFIGDQSDYSNFMVERAKLHGEIEDYLKINSNKLLTLNTLKYGEKIDSLMEIEQSQINKFISTKENLDKWFAKKIDVDIRFFFKIVKLVYPARFCRTLNKDANVESDYFNRIANNAFNDPDYLRSQMYLDFVKKYLDVQTAGEYKYTNFYNLTIKLAGMPRYKAIIDLNAHKQITDYFLANLLKSHIDFGVKNIKDIVELFKVNCKNDGLKEEVIQLFNKQLERRKLPSEILVYKKANNVELEAHIFYPNGFKKTDKRPLYIFFHGGSWNDGNPEWGYSGCQKYASKGMVAISFEYRLIDLHGVAIPSCIDDAKSAIRWARENERKLGINDEKIVAEGFSAGGHLAACTAIIEDINDESTNKYSCRPNALILKSASYSVKGFGGMKGGNGELFSPYYQVKGGLIPTIMFHGTEDRIVPYKEFTGFIDKMKELENDFVYHSFKYAGHFDLLNTENDKIESEMIDEFLFKYGFIDNF